MMEVELIQQLGNIGIDANTLILGYLFWKLHDRLRVVELNQKQCCGD